MQKLFFEGAGTGVTRLSGSAKRNTHHCIYDSKIVTTFVQQQIRMFCAPEVTILVHHNMSSLAGETEKMPSFHRTFYDDGARELCFYPPGVLRSNPGREHSAVNPK